MENFLLLINAFFVWFFWQSAKVAFAEERNAGGWFDVFLSAFNFAIIMNFLL